MPDGLSSLNEFERRILALLAQGHTAKSVATETGVSVHSVNERLRDARRKTGASSSRELARLFADKGQENRDDKIDLGSAPAAPATPRRIDALNWRWIAMAVIALAAAAAWFLAPPPAPHVEPPRVVSFRPADFGPMRAGKVTLRLEFDRPMRRNSYSFVRIDEGSYPDCPNPPRQSPDGRSFVLDCTLLSGRTYAIGVNIGPYRNFVGADDGIPAQPWKLMFAVP